MGSGCYNIPLKMRQNKIRFKLTGHDLPDVALGRLWMRLRRLWAACRWDNLQAASQPSPFLAVWRACSEKVLIKLCEYKEDTILLQPWKGKTHTHKHTDLMYRTFSYVKTSQLTYNSVSVNWKEKYAGEIYVYVHSLRKSEAESKLFIWWLFPTLHSSS